MVGLTFGVGFIFDCVSEFSVWNQDICTYCSITLVAIACVSWGVKECRHLYSGVSGRFIIVCNKIRIRIKV
jgi:hypothetical protein